MKLLLQQWFKKKGNVGLSGQLRDLFLKGLLMINNALDWLKNPQTFKTCLEPNPHLEVERVRGSVVSRRLRGAEGSVGDQWRVRSSTHARMQSRFWGSQLIHLTYYTLDRVTLWAWHTCPPRKLTHKHSSLHLWGAIAAVSEPAAPHSQPLITFSGLLIQFCEGNECKASSAVGWEGDAFVFVGAE